MPPGLRLWSAPSIACDSEPIIEPVSRTSTSPPPERGRMVCERSLKSRICPILPLYEKREVNCHRRFRWGGKSDTNQASCRTFEERENPCRDARFSAIQEEFFWRLS